MEKGRKYSRSSFASVLIHLSGQNSVGSLKILGLLIIPHVGTLTTVYRSCQCDACKVV